MGFHRTTASSVKLTPTPARRSFRRALDGGWGALAVGCLLLATSLACSLSVAPPAEPIFLPAASTPEIVFPSMTPATQPVETPAAPVLMAVNSGAGDSVDTAATPETAGTDGLSLTPSPAASTLEASAPPPLLYYAQAGDTLPALAIRYGVEMAEITSPQPIPTAALLSPGLVLLIPNRLANTTSSETILPDSEVVFSPSGVGFDVPAFVAQAGGYLSTYREYLGSTGWTSGADIVYRVALENSINPRLLLALLEYQSGWVYGQPADLARVDYPLGKIALARKGLYAQLAWAVNQLSIGYYGWREGRLTEIRFSDGVTARLAPSLNAGSVALQYFMAQLYDTPGWVLSLDPAQGLPALHERMFGSPWLRALEVEPLFPANLEQPDLALPFLYNQIWSLTGGPHAAWEHDGAWAALDFAPGGTESGCVDTELWASASAPGLVVREGHGVLVLDLDGDGYEQTGWVLLYLHLKTQGRLKVGDWLEAGDLIGHPSCEGGVSTGTHIHFARKFNGEWIPADGPLPFNLDGWIAHAGQNPYEGSLTRGDEIVQASVYGSFESRIVRRRETP